MKVTIKLVVFILEEKSFKYNILSLDSSNLDLPSIDIEKYQDIDTTLKHLIERYVKVNNNFCIKSKLIGVNISEQVDIVYYCIIPFNPAVKDSYLLDLEKYEPISNDIRKVWQALIGKNI